MKTVKFDRIGRRHNPPDLPLRSDDPDRIAEEVWTYARTFLMSRNVTVGVDLDTKTVSIFAGFHNAGSGTIVEDGETND